MVDIFAREFAEIPETLVQNAELREQVLQLIDREPVPGKVTEGGDRLRRFREILGDLVRGSISLEDAYRRTEGDLPRSDSIHAADNRVFAQGWAERLVRTQFSRFYNQAVMEQLLLDQQTECFVPHSSSESSRCSIELAGKVHNLKALYERSVHYYATGDWGDTNLKVPEHPHCSHVVIPVP